MARTNAPVESEEAKTGHTKHSESNDMDMDTEQDTDDSSIYAHENPVEFVVLDDNERYEPYPEKNHAQKNSKPKKVSPPTSLFITRVSAYPIVKDSASAVHTMATRSAVGRLALTMATSTLSTLSTLSSITQGTSGQPQHVQSYYQNYVRPHLQRADQLGCRSLDLIQTNFPVIHQPTDKIAEAVTDTSLRAMEDVRLRVDSTLHTLVVPAHHVARAANDRLGSVVDHAEATLDYYLSLDRPSTGSQQDHDKNQVLRAYQLLHQATLRLSQHVTEHVASTPSPWPLSHATLARLTETSALLQTATHTLQSIHQTLQHSMALYGQAAQDTLPSFVVEALAQIQRSTSEGLQRLTLTVSDQLQQMVAFAKYQAHDTPEWLRQSIETGIQAAQHHLETVARELKRTDITYYEKAVHVAQGIQEQVLPLLELVQSHLLNYKEHARQKAQDDLKVPLEYLGLSCTPQVAQAN
ncbi:hypothetical protein BDF14DRAFT_1834668 [Spinellus fusiger]|nr:hypothetical protein BDF14DRAFT_1834668 [Spinellus fusiger]